MFLAVSQLCNSSRIFWFFLAVCRIARFSFFFAVCVCVWGGLLVNTIRYGPAIFMNNMNPRWQLWTAFEKRIYQIQLPKYYWHGITWKLRIDANNLWVFSLMLYRVQAWQSSKAFTRPCGWWISFPQYKPFPATFISMENIQTSCIS